MTTEQHISRAWRDSWQPMCCIHGVNPYNLRHVWKDVPTYTVKHLSDNHAQFDIERITLFGLN